ncbi:MAG: hypothetical protein U0694_27620 [Anaerolineae bacterium]
MAFAQRTRRRTAGTPAGVRHLFTGLLGMMELHNKYGHFNADGNAFIITDPNTPMPWVNVLSNGDYGMVISQAGSGYSWRTHASLNRITRWDQDLLRDEWGKYIFIRDMDTGEFWSPTYQPCGTGLTHYQVSHELGSTLITSRFGTIEHAITYFVPQDTPCEVWHLTLRNHGDQPRRLQVFTYFEWLLGAAPDWHREFHKTFINTEYDAQHGAILATKVMWELPVASKAHWNQDWEYVAFHSASVTPSGFDCDKRDFIGRNGRLSSPKALRTGTSAGRAGRWGDPIGSLQVQLTIAPQQQQSVTYTLGAADNREQALSIVQRFNGSWESTGKPLEQTWRYWSSLVTRLQVKTLTPP